ncbi:substrate of the Dot/Icm secretion system [Legionella gratiana]|uniref:Dot/Icm secretion system substrate n=1 Tax=Legionella gratiana TaxID=45066 RepID=A0A378JDS1_9GAMM|nr:Dot/Icm T4SS effector Ceg14/sidL [Legionella gratiana]KTD06370.1 substrate of the Dot/Icm secretion system [Legionella gratiana]STX45188.1 Dot/Icm secretion system substrate [Legionella gratiana]
MKINNHIESFLTMKNYRDIAELLKSYAKETTEMVISSSYKTTESVKNVSDCTTVLIHQSVKETRKVLEEASKETRELLEKTSKETRELLEKACNGTEKYGTRKINSDRRSLTHASSTEFTRSEQMQNEPQLLTDTLESLFSLLINKIDSNKEQKQHLRAIFLKVILSKDIALFNELLLKLELDKSNFEQYERLLDLHKKAPLSILNSPVLAYVQKELAKENIKSLISLLLNVFQSIPELSNENTGICLSMREKKELLPALLEKTKASIKMSALSQLTDLSFDSLLPSFRPSLGDKNYIPMMLTHKKYLEVVTKGVDQSMFITMTIGYLSSNKLASKNFLQKVAADYLFVNYEGCLNAIEAYFRDLILPKDFPKYYENHFRSICKYVKEVDSLKNDTRRFFETRLAQYINGLTHSEETLNSQDEPYEGLFDDSKLKLKTLNAANKILNFFLGSEGLVSSPIDMERKISIFANGYKDKEKYNQKKLLHFMKSCRAYQGRDRIPKAKETGILERKYETSAQKVGADTWNSAGGVMRSTSATFVDAQRNPMRNMLVDSSEVSPKKDIDPPQWFWSNNRFRAAYVGSISGHTCHIVFMLNCYMQENRQDPNLSQDINLFLLQLIAVYAKRGYHGMLEVIDVLHDSLIQEVFKKNNVTLDLFKYFSCDLEVGAFLEYAMNDTSVYAQVLANKQHVKYELSRLFNPSMISVGKESVKLDNMEDDKIMDIMLPSNN